MAKLSSLSITKTLCLNAQADYAIEEDKIVIFSVGIDKKASDLLAKKIRATFKSNGADVSFNETFDQDLCDEDEDNGYVLEAVVALS